MNRCKRCGSPNCLLREGNEVVCVLCGFVNDSTPSAENREWARMIHDVLEEDGHIPTVKERSSLRGTHTHSPAFGGATTETGVWAR